MKIRKTSDLKKQKFNAVIVGHAGSGKTSLARTLPNLDKTLFINIKRYEDGESVLSDLSIDVLDIETFEQLKSLPELLKSSAASKYEYVYFDGISAASKISIKHFREITKKSNNNYDKYNLHGEFLNEFLLDMKTINKHVIFTCLPDVRKAKESQEVYSFLVDGNMFSKTLEQAVDAILPICSDGSGSRRLLTQNNGVWVAKLRHPGSVKIDTFINVDFDKKDTGLTLILKKLGYL